MVKGSAGVMSNVNFKKIPCPVSLLFELFMSILKRAHVG